MHAVASAVAPAFFTYGAMRSTGGGGGGGWGPAFPQYVIYVIRDSTPMEDGLMS